MNRAEFIDSLVSDIDNYLYEQGPDHDRDNLYDDLFVSWVTGNDSGCYGYTQEARRACDWDAMELYLEACDEFCCDPKKHLDPDSVIVTIRCYLLGEALCEYETLHGATPCEE